jgi:hypothetical protein
MLSDGAQAAQVITVLQATLDAAGYSSVGINCCDAEGWSISSITLQDAQAAGGTAHMNAATSHGYAGALAILRLHVSTQTRLHPSGRQSGPIVPTYVVNFLGRYGHDSRWVGMGAAGLK